jgi:hypothetical protein
VKVSYRVSFRINPCVERAYACQARAYTGAEGFIHSEESVIVIHFFVWLVCEQILSRMTALKKTHHEPAMTHSASPARNSCNPTRPAVAQQGAHAVLTATAPDTPPPQRHLVGLPRFHETSVAAKEPPVHLMTVTGAPLLSHLE